MNQRKLPHLMDYSEYLKLEDLIAELVMNPDTLFIRDRGCEALVYVQEIDQILLLEDKHFRGSHEQIEEHLQRKLAEIKRDNGAQ